MKLPDITEDALLRLRNHVSLTWLAHLITDNCKGCLTGETAGKLATFLRSLDDEGLGSYVEFLRIREDLSIECKDYEEAFGELAKELSDDID